MGRGYGHGPGFSGAASILGIALFAPTLASYGCREDAATITVTEAEDPEGGFCDYLCLFDHFSPVENLEPGGWTIRFSEPCLREGDEAIEFTVDLLPATEGEYCVSRKSRPWGR